MNLQELPPDTRPREKILTRGPSALSDTELLALLLRTGIAGRNVLQLAQDMLLASGGLANLLLNLPQHAPAIKGLGPAKQAELLAVMDLAKRAMAQQLSTREVMQSAASVQLYLQLHLAYTSHEVFAMLFLDAQHTQERSSCAPFTIKVPQLFSHTTTPVVPFIPAQPTSTSPKA
jgi:DNA repair protein RadC